MDKLSLHESFRIYLPGLLFCIIAYLLYKNTATDISVVAIPAIFIGFALNVPLFKVNRWYFNRIVSNHKIKIDLANRYFLEHQNSIFKYKHSIFKNKMSEELIDVEDITEYGWRFTMLSFFSRNYDSPETSSFRLPKSLGVMCFNFFVISFSLPIIFLIYAAFQNSFSDFQKAVVLISLLLSAMFLVSAKNFMVESLTKELHYWGSISLEEYERLAKTYRLQKNWNQATTDLQN